MTHQYNTPPLTDEEKHIIIDKGTEHPGTGTLLSEKRNGTYLCRQCGSPLYLSSHKFDSQCGWPAFDDAIPGAIRRVTDPDGIRTEVTCTMCDGHLGHVFVGERMTEQNMRHCVNSLSMTFTTDEVEIPRYSIAVFGGGCFWCVEAVFQQLGGVIEVRSGYMGGDKTYPRSELVYKDQTGHAEVVQVYFDEKVISYEMLVRVFFSSHNPTTLNQQGADRGTQYRSVIFTDGDDQERIARTVLDEIDSSGVRDDPLVTQIQSVEKFWPAEGYHQDFYHQNSTKPYCQIVINPKLEKLKKERSHLLKI